MAKAQRPRTIPERIATFIGVTLILVGLGFLGYVAWQYFGTNIVSKHKQTEIKSQLKIDWGKGIDADAIGLLRVPRFGKDYEVPIVKGGDFKDKAFTNAALAKGAAWYEAGAKPGEIGNFAIAGHRVTHGEVFAKFPTLRRGDKVEVETRTNIYTYVLRNSGTSLTVDFSAKWVLMPNPIDRNFKATMPLLTMLTCSEIFHTRNRSVVFGDLVNTVTKTGKTTGNSS
ncbi:MAG: sortase [Aeromicrobium sp.]